MNYNQNEKIAQITSQTLIIDARVIAQLVQDGRYAEPNIPQGVYAELRVARKIRDLLYEYFTKRPNNPLKKMQSLIAICSKLIRILFTIGKKKCEFSEERMLRDSPHMAALQITAA